MQSTPWCPGQPDLLARIQHNLLEGLRAEPHLDGWWILTTRGTEVRMRNRHFHMILLLHRDGFTVVMKTHFFTAYSRAVFSVETAWQSPGSYRQVSSLKHPLSSCKRSPRGVSNTEKDYSAVILDFKQRLSSCNSGFQTI